MTKTFYLEVHTPYRLFFSGNVEYISVTLIDGEKGVHANHSPFVAPVVPCILSIKEEEGTIRTAFIADGLLEVTEIKTLLLVDTGEWPDEIDTERALKAKQEADEKLRTAILKFETEHAKTKLRRAEIRLKAAGTIG